MEILKPVSIQFVDRLKHILFTKLRATGSTGQCLGEHEILPVTYLESLAPVDRSKIEDLVSWTPCLRAALEPDLRIGILAVGSSVQPKGLRYHPVKDLDIRILNSAPTSSNQRGRAEVVIVAELRKYLAEREIDFEAKNHTLETRMVRGGGGLVEWLDWYNNDPSFETTPKTGFPLHLSVSGFDNFELDTYIQKNRESTSYFSVLLHDR